MTVPPGTQQPENQDPFVRRLPANGRGERIALAALLALAATLRLYQLDSQFWFDEISAILNNIRRPFADLLLQWAGPANHALVEALSHASIAAFGESPFAARLPAAAFGIAGVWALYALARELVEHRYALTVAALLAVSYHHVFYSQNARGYSALIFFFLVATRIAVRSWNRGSLSVRDAGLYAVAAALAAWSQFSGVLIAPAQLAVVVAAAALAGARGRTMPWPRFAASALSALLLSALIFSPYLSRLAGTARSAAAAPAEGPRVGTNLLLEFVDGLTAAFFGPVGLTVAVVIALIGTVSWWRRHPFSLAVMLAPVVLQLVTLVVLGLGIHPRYVIIALPVGLMIGAAGVVTIVRVAVARIALDRRALEYALLCGVVLLSAMPLYGYYRAPKQDFLGAVAAVERAAGPGDSRVAVQLVDRAVNGYYNRGWSRADNLPELLAIEQRGGRVYAVTTLERLLAIEDADLHAHLAAHYQRIATFPGTVGGGAVHVYSRGDASVGPSAR